MKTFLQNLLIFFALCLCGLIAFQWVRETELRKDIQGLNDKFHDEQQKGIDLDARVKHDEAEITRLDGLKNQLTQLVKSNETVITTMHHDLVRSTNVMDLLTDQVEKFSNAVHTANENLLKQNEDIKKQNAEILKVVEERNDFAKKFSSMTKQYNDLANKWNQQQEELAKAATNAPPKK